MAILWQLHLKFIYFHSKIPHISIPIMYFNDFKHEHKLFDDLSRALDLDNVDNILWNNKCDYYDIEKCTNLNRNKYNLVILQLNLRCLLAHELELKILLNTLNNENLPVDAVVLSETFLSKCTEKLTNTPGYTLITNSKKDSKGGEVGILIKNNITYKCRQDLEVMIEKHVETLHIEITAKSGKKMVL